MALSTLFIGYCSVGILIVSTQAIRHKLKPLNHRHARYLEERRWQGVLGKFIEPVIAITILVIGWPVALATLRRKRARNPSEPGEIEFRVKPADLVVETTIAEIEAAEMVTDPLNAVPELPFGHLNAAWAEFKGKLNPPDSIYRFESDWTDTWGFSQQLTGYVIVRDGGPSSFFLTQRVGLGNRQSSVVPES